MSQKLQILRNSRTMQRTILQKAQHLLIPAFPAFGQSFTETCIWRMRYAIKEKNLAEEPFFFWLKNVSLASHPTP